MSRIESLSSQEAMKSAAPIQYLSRSILWEAKGFRVKQSQGKVKCRALPVTCGLGRKSDEGCG